MALTVDWNAKVISIPQSDLTFISGTLYDADTDAIRLQLKSIEAGEGIPFEDTHRHNTEVTIVGVTFARTIEIINGYSLQFTPDSQYTVRLTGSNNNFFDVANGVLVQNQVQVIPNNSAGLVVVNTGSGLSPEQDSNLNLIKFQDQKVYINTESLEVGDGSAREPFNTIADALDFAEASGIHQIILLADATLDRNFKGFRVSAIGLSSLDLGGQNVTNTIFKDVRLKGMSTTGAPTFSFSVNNCSLDDGLSGLAGGFVSSVITGNITGAPGLFSFFSQMSTSGLFNTPAISMPAGAAHDSVVEDITGCLTLKNFTRADHTMDICLNGCCLTIDSTCTLGSIVVTGTGHIVDDSAGVTIDSINLLTMPNIVKRTWEALVNDYAGVSGSFAEFIKKKLLTVSKFLGLK